MTHPRLSVDALCSFSWTFEQDLAAWEELDVRTVGILASKLNEGREAKIQKLQAASIRSSTVLAPRFDLGRRETWDATRASIAGAVDLAVATNGTCVYLTTGRSNGSTWESLLGTFGDAIAPSVALAADHGVRLAIEPSLRPDVSFVHSLRDATYVAETTGVAVIVDFANCWMERDLGNALRRAAPHTALVQICDVIIGSPSHPSPSGAVRVLPGEGDLPLHRLMSEVLDTGYSGVFDLEVVGASIESEGYQSALRRGVDLASRFLTETGA